MAPRPPVGLMRLHEANRTDMSNPFHLDDQVRSEFEKEVDQSQHGAGQPSSTAPIPATNTGNVDENSNHLIELSIMPPSTHLLSQSFMLFYLIYYKFFEGG